MLCAAFLTTADSSRRESSSRPTGRGFRQTKKRLKRFLNGVERVIGGWPLRTSDAGECSAVSTCQVRDPAHERRRGYGGNLTDLLAAAGLHSFALSAGSTNRLHSCSLSKCY